MKANFSREAISDALSLVTSVVPSRTPKPILRCVHIIASENEVRMCGTDLEVGINYLLSEVQVEEPGEAVVPADSLAAIVRESADEVLSLEIKQGKCEIKGSDSHFTIYGQEPGQYPKVPDFQGKDFVQLPLSEFQSAVSQCLFATAKESTRYAINGILWELADKKLSLVATDGRRLARVRLTLPKEASQKTSESEKSSIPQIIIPAKTMSLLEKIDSQDQDTVAVKFHDNQIVINCGNVVISSNLVEGNFPKYEDIIPKGYEKKLTLSTEPALSAVRRAALLTSEESRGIKLSIGKDTLVFSGRAPETGDAEITMPIEYKGEPIEIGFSPQFLTDVLKVMKSPQFEMELSQPDRPGLIKSGTNFLYVLMPISLG